LDKECTVARHLLGLENATDQPIPIGVGLVTFHPTISLFNDTVIPLLSKHKPMAIWLFAPVPDSATHREIIETLHNVGSSWNIKVFVQVGSVSAARDAIHDGADGIVAQGIGKSAAWSLSSSSGPRFLVMTFVY